MSPFLLHIHLNIDIGTIRILFGEGVLTNKLLNFLTEKYIFGGGISLLSSPLTALMKIKISGYQIIYYYKLVFDVCMTQTITIAIIYFILFV